MSYLLVENSVAELADLFRLLGDNTRLRIVLTCLDEPIAGKLDCNSLVSHHLRLLKAARIVKADLHDKQVFYATADQHISDILTNMLEHIAEPHTTENYQWFSLGMAPLAGLERRPLAPLWHKIGTTIFDLGDHFYNFEGLCEYKAKFAPLWQPRYLAAPAGVSVPFILMTITRLISGGWQGIFSK